ncbi:TonB-dependent receptor [Flagellatimonas centrodinii]|uniref:TonB-dependent receptor n=1 Tax=Flagellatimonas centrodinii TaxID=2806210 RepID=UPI001FEFA4DD|nr:TonB-dependent receptor [Flagellatimonas centrodinii]ULQ45568.1 TonB-dependent receptor [Flagellatimonas centrodinii]
MRGVLGGVLAGWATMALAGGVPATPMETITVDGTRQPGAAISASEGLVTGAQLEARPVTRVAELLEFIPGMIATQHSGEGKANQYFLRGFNLDHGTDFASFVDGMPVNMRSHGHGQGYSDLNFLIPELVHSLAYRKGPYYADVGDFSAAGSADFILQRQLDAPTLSLTAGENGFVRSLAAGSTAAADGHFTLAADVTRYDGPWVLDQDLSALKWLGRYSRGSFADGFDITLMGYDSQWDATDQIPARAVADGRIDRLGFIDPTVGGDSSRYSLSFNLRRPAGEGHWALSGYAIDYALDLFSNFTYFLEDPVNGDQFEQLDERRIYGLSGLRQWPLPGALPGSIELGAELRHDAISDVGLFRTQARQRLATIRRDQIDETSLGAYAQVRLLPTERLRVVAGLRVDGYRFDVDADQPENGGRADDHIVSPKLSLSYDVAAPLTVFLNAGRGFHSNDARGTTITVDPAAPVPTPVDAVEPLVAADAVDLGMVARLSPTVQLSATLWGLKLDSELVYVGDAGATEASDASERYGVEVAAYLTPLPWLILDIDYAWSHARFDISDPADRIPGAVEQVASVGLTMTDRGRLSGGLRVRYLGSAPLIEDNSARSEATTVVNLQAAYQLTPQFSLGAGVFNLLDSEDNDITYFYASRLPGEPANGIEDVHFHPVEPRQFRATLRYRWGG